MHNCHWNEALAVNHARFAEAAKHIDDLSGEDVLRLVEGLASDLILARISDIDDEKAHLQQLGNISLTRGIKK